MVSGTAPLSLARAQSADSVPRVYAARGRAPLPADSVVAGMRVHLYAPGVVFDRTGTLQGRFGDTLLFLGARHRELVRVPLARTEWLRVSTGRGMTMRHQLAGVGVGAVLGTWGAVVYQMMTRERRASDCGFSCPGSARRRWNGALIGAAVGFGVAAHWPGDRWRLVALPAGAR